MKKPSQALIDKWYKKLKDSGFEDIEDVKSPREMLRQWDSQYFQNVGTPDQFLARQEYYSLCREFLNTHKFLSKHERKVWEFHSEGVSYRETAKALKAPSNKVLQTVQRLKGFMEGLEIRDATPDDKAFIYASWLRGAYYGNSFMTGIKKQKFFQHYAVVLDHLLKKPNVKVKVTCLRSDPSAIQGYMVYENTTLHWIFVKTGWREQGIARSMIGNIPFLTVTHSTKIGDAIRKKKGYDFNPWAI